MGYTPPPPAPPEERPRCERCNAQMVRVDRVELAISDDLEHQDVTVVAWECLIGICEFELLDVSGVQG